MLPRKYHIFALLNIFPLIAGAQSLPKPESNIVSVRLNVPAKHERTKADAGSFAAFLRHLPLLPAGSDVKFSDGSAKQMPHCAAVIDMEIDNKNLQQSAQSLMRLRAEYLYEQQLFSNIHFHIRNGNPIPYDEWSKGMKIIVDRKAYWTKTPNNPKKYRTFRLYLEFIFEHSDFETLQQDIEAIPFSDLVIGDLLILNTGDSNHALMILDMAVHPRTGQQMVLLATGGAPAQSIQIVANNKSLGAWFPVNKNGEIQVRDIVFSEGNAYRFRK